MYFLIGDMPLILVLYVDDLFLTRDERLVGDCKSNLAMEFKMNDLGLMYYLLGLEVLVERWMLLHQTGEVSNRYPEEI